MTAPTRDRPIRGVIAPILTPFEDDLGVASTLFAQHADRLLAAGCAGLAPFGTTGEALSIGVAERIAALDALIAARIDPARLIPGTGLTNLPETAALSRACLDRGCHGVMVLPPFYIKQVTEDGLHAYFARLIETIGRARPNIVLYHIPQVAGVGIPPALAARLKRDFPDEIVGIKDSSGDRATTEALLAIPGLAVYPGSEHDLLDILARGGPGCITASANLNANAIAESVRLHDAGDATGAATHHEAAVRPVRRTLHEGGFVAGQKRLMAMATGDARWANVRPPLLPATEPEGRALAARLPAGLLSRREPA